MIFNYFLLKYPSIMTQFLTTLSVCKFLAINNMKTKLHELANQNVSFIDSKVIFFWSFDNKILSIWSTRNFFLIIAILIHSFHLLISASNSRKIHHFTIKIWKISNREGTPLPTHPVSPPDTKSWIRPCHSTSRSYMHLNYWQ